MPIKTKVETTSSGDTVTFNTTMEEEMKGLIVEVLKSSNKQWYFRIKAQNGKIILTSEVYKTKQSAFKSADIFKKPVEYKFVDLT